MAHREHGGAGSGAEVAPLFPRLHASVLDGSDKGPRPPPRNKMALFESPLVAPTGGSTSTRSAEQPGAQQTAVQLAAVQSPPMGAVMPPQGSMWPGRPPATAAFDPMYGYHPYAYPSYGAWGDYMPAPSRGMPGAGAPPVAPYGYGIQNPAAARPTQTQPMNSTEREWGAPPSAPRQMHPPAQSQQQQMQAQPQQPLSQHLLSRQQAQQGQQLCNGAPQAPSDQWSWWWQQQSMWMQGIQRLSGGAQPGLIRHPPGAMMDSARTAGSLDQFGQRPSSAGCATDPNSFAATGVTVEPTAAHPQPTTVTMDVGPRQYPYEVARMSAVGFEGSSANDRGQDFALRHNTRHQAPLQQVSPQTQQYYNSPSYDHSIPNRRSHRNYHQRVRPAGKEYQSDSAPQENDAMERVREAWPEGANANSEQFAAPFEHPESPRDNALANGAQSPQASSSDGDDNAGADAGLPRRASINSDGSTKQEDQMDIGGSSNNSESGQAGILNDVDMPVVQSESGQSVDNDGSGDGSGSGVSNAEGQVTNGNGSGSGGSGDGAVVTGLIPESSPDGTGSPDGSAERSGDGHALEGGNSGGSGGGSGRGSGGGGSGAGSGGENGNGSGSGNNANGSGGGSGGSNTGAAAAAGTGAAGLATVNAKLDKQWRSEADSASSLERGEVAPVTVMAVLGAAKFLKLQQIMIRQQHSFVEQLKELHEAIDMQQQIALSLRALSARQRYVVPASQLAEAPSRVPSGTAHPVPSQASAGQSAAPYVVVPPAYGAQPNFPQGYWRPPPAAALYPPAVPPQPALYSPCQPQWVYPRSASRAPPRSVLPHRGRQLPVDQMSMAAWYAHHYGASLPPQEWWGPSAAEPVARFNGAGMGGSGSALQEPMQAPSADSYIEVGKEMSGSTQRQQVLSGKQQMPAARSNSNPAQPLGYTSADLPAQAVHHSFLAPQMQPPQHMQPSMAQAQQAAQMQAYERQVQQMQRMPSPRTTHPHLSTRSPPPLGVVQVSTSLHRQLSPHPLNSAFQPALKSPTSRDPTTAQGSAQRASASKRHRSSSSSEGGAKGSPAPTAVRHAPGVISFSKTPVLPSESQLRAVTIQDRRERSRPTKRINDTPSEGIARITGVEKQREVQDKDGKSENIHQMGLPALLRSQQQLHKQTMAAPAAPVFLNQQPQTETPVRMYKQKPQLHLNNVHPPVVPSTSASASLSLDSRPSYSDSAHIVPDRHMLTHLDRVPTHFRMHGKTIADNMLNAYPDQGPVMGPSESGLRGDSTHAGLQKAERRRISGDECGILRSMHRAKGIAQDSAADILLQLQQSQDR